MTLRINQATMSDLTEKKIDFSETGFSMKYTGMKPQETTELI